MSSTLDAIMWKIYFYFDGDMGPQANIVIPWKVFVGLLSSGEKPVYGSIRTIREKWQQLHYTGYLTAVNSYASKINMGPFLKAIGKYPPEE